MTAGWWCWCKDGANSVRDGALGRLRLFVASVAVAVLIGASATDARQAWAEPVRQGKQVRTSPYEDERSRTAQRPVRQPGSGGTARRGERVWPVSGKPGTASTRPEVKRAWEPPPSPWASGHRGVDLAAGRGRPVRSVGDGRVSFSGTVAGRGVLSIELSGTGDPPVRTTYEPVRASVREGEKVRAGQVVATVAENASHCHDGCLHWGARRDERYLDPLSLLPPGLLHNGPSRLLPFYGTPVPGGRAATPDRHSRNGTSETTGGTPTGPNRAEAVNTSAVAGPVGAGGVVLTLALAGAALLARRRLSRACRAGSSKRPP
ncbi:murein hydrolase activator EnvC family protein [Streptomyces ovatisporus]|uniref:Murein hydrolase activator EnvC family protein n=1 Tax=Streptomyces ovatisporus TaxID=1128682 RepID=A0ABV9A4E5_9ACTN